MFNLATGILFIAFGLVWFSFGIFDVNKEIKQGRRLIEALYAQLEYKYDPNDQTTKVLFAENSWLTSMRTVVVGDKDRYMYIDDGKNLVQKVRDLDDKVRDLDLIKEDKKIDKAKTLK